MARELSRRPVPVPGPGTRMALDAALGASLAAAVAVRTGSRAVAPVARLLWQPPLVPTALHPRTVVHALARTGRVERQLLTRRLGVVLDAWLPVVVEAAVSRLDLTALVARHVDLDALVATVDLDRAVARVDVDAVVRRVAIDQILDRVDVDEIVARVDIGAVLDRVDVDEVARRLDVDAVVARVDLDAVIDRIDLVGIVEEVLDEIDLPGIIRDSTGSMASETVRGVRMTGISADDAVARAVDRVFLRRRQRAGRDGADG